VRGRVLANLIPQGVLKRVFVRHDACHLHAHCGVTRRGTTADDAPNRGAHCLIFTDDVLACDVGGGSTTTAFGWRRLGCRGRRRGETSTI